MKANRGFRKIGAEQRFSRHAKERQQKRHKENEAAPVSTIERIRKLLASLPGTPWQADIDVGYPHFFDGWTGKIYTGEGAWDTYYDHEGSAEKIKALCELVNAVRELVREERRVLSGKRRAKD